MTKHGKQSNIVSFPVPSRQKPEPGAKWCWADLTDMARTRLLRELRRTEALRTEILAELEALGGSPEQGVPIDGLRTPSPDDQEPV